jgi:hypothetical protein
MGSKVSYGVNKTRVPMDKVGLQMAIKNQQAMILRSNKRWIYNLIDKIPLTECDGFL